MGAKQIAFSTDARVALEAGVDKVASAVKLHSARKAAT